MSPSMIDGSNAVKGEKQNMDRREFIKATTSSAIALTAGSQAMGGLTTEGMTAKSYNRVIGANDRLRLGGIGPGDRGSGRVATAQKLGAENRSASEALR